MSNNSQNQQIVARLRAKYESALWDLLYNHPDGVAVAADYALGDLNQLIKTNPKLSLGEQYMIFAANFIKKGNRLDTGDLLQSYTATQLKKLIDNCFGDFPLLLFCLMLLSQPSIRETYSKGSSKDLQLYLDLIYSMTIGYDKVNINPLPIEDRYLIAESLAFELT
jgi:hypothetical protein